MHGPLLMDTPDMEKFKYDYPEVFEKFLEMNRALAKIQRKLSRAENESPFPDQSDEETGNWLEVD